VDQRTVRPNTKQRNLGPGCCRFAKKRGEAKSGPTASPSIIHEVTTQGNSCRRNPYVVRSYKRLRSGWQAEKQKQARQAQCPQQAELPRTVEEMVEQAVASAAA
jgi:hypothetical protein